MSTLLVLAGLFLAGCAEPQITPEHRLPPIPHDSSIAITTTVQIEEKDIPISHILHVAVSPNGRLMAISDNISGYVFLYERSTGRLRHLFQHELHFCDSLALKEKPFMPGFRFLTIRELSDSLGGTIPKDFATQWLRNTFENATFVDDNTLLLTGVLQGFMQNTSGAYQRISQGQTALFRYDIPSGKIAVTPFKFTDPRYVAQTGAILAARNEEEIAASIMNQRELSANRYDSMWTVGIFRHDGAPVRGLMPLPEEYRAQALAYNGLQPSMTLDDQGEILATYGFSPAVFNVTRNQRLPLDSLPLSNAAGLAVARKRGDIPPDSLLQLLPVRVWSVSMTPRGTCLVTIQLADSTDAPSRWIIQEYSERPWSLLRQKLVPHPEEYGDVKQVSYSRADDSLLLFTLSKSGGWTLLTAKY